MRSLPSSAPSTRRAERGQVIVIFAGGIVLFMLLLAVVLDVSWYWANTLRVQRAADAAALAGAVYLPGNRTTAYLRRPCGGPEERIHRRAAPRRSRLSRTARTRARRLTTRDSSTSRYPPRSNTYFMRVIGISTVQATRASKAEYVLPVPMGSPQNYYGVGFFQGVAPARTETFAGSTDFVRPFAAPTPTNWTTPALCLRRRRDPHRPRMHRPSHEHAATTTTTMQAYGDFRVSIPAGATVTGIEVRMQAYSPQRHLGCRHRGSPSTPGMWRSPPQLDDRDPEVGPGASPPRDDGAGDARWHQ